MSDTSPAPALKIAVVGAGPAGFYTVEALVAGNPACEVDLIDRLPTPYGLIRSGVAPDHQNTKTIQDTFEKIALQPQVRYLGNVEIGRDLTLEELRGFYDAVVLSFGVPQDAPLGIPGEELAGVYGAAEFVGWYNGHPDQAALDPALDRPGAVIIGNGNVAIDIARILSKSAAELARSDIAAHALDAIVASPPGEVHIVGRRGAAEAKFTTVELSELGELEQAVALADPAEIPDAPDPALSPRDRRVKAKNLDCFRAFAAADPESRPRRIRFRFNARPVAILGTGRVEAVRFERTEVTDGRAAGTGTFFEIPCGLVVSAIGYRVRPFAGLEPAANGASLRNEDGLIAPGLYVAGWLKRGPSGKIGTNRNDGEEVANRLLAEVAPQGAAGRKGLLALLAARGIAPTDFAGWKRIEAAEIAGATHGAPRRKLTSLAEMLAAARA